MSQRHQSRRRRSYGRRQHEVRERRTRRDVWPAEADADEPVEDADRPAPALADLFSGHLRLAEGT